MAIARLSSFLKRVFSLDNAHAPVQAGSPEPPSTPQPAPTPVAHAGDRLVIVDVGCRWGFAEKFLGQPNDFLVFGFDPDAAECERLNKKYASDYVTAVPIGLSSTTGPKTLYLTREPACSSLIQPDAYLTSNYPALGCATEIGRTEIQTTTLDEWSSAAGLPGIDYLKIDTQGTELDILMGGQRQLKTVRAIEVEVEFNPIYKGQPLFSDVDHFLRAQGFVLWKLSNMVHYSKKRSAGAPIGKDIVCFDDYHVIRSDVYAGQIYWANAQYVRLEIIRDFKSLGAWQQERDRMLFQVLEMHDVTE